MAKPAASLTPLTIGPHSLPGNVYIVRMASIGQRPGYIESYPVSWEIAYHKALEINWRNHCPIASIIHKPVKELIE